MLRGDYPLALVSSAISSFVFSLLRIRIYIEKYVICYTNTQAVLMCTRMDVALKHTDRHTSTYAHMHACTHMHTRTHMHTHTHACVHTSTHTHTHTHNIS